MRSASSTGDRFGVELDPETQAVATIGAKEGLVAPDVGAARAGRRGGRAEPELSDPLYAPILAGASVHPCELGAERRPLDGIADAFERSPPPPRVVIVSFPHNPTTRVVDLEFMQRLVDLAREHEVLVVHDFAYAESCFDGYQPPSILQVPGADDVAVELYSLTKSYSMAGWRVGFTLGNAEVVGGPRAAQVATSTTAPSSRSRSPRSWR